MPGTDRIRPAIFEVFARKNPNDLAGEDLRFNTKRQGFDDKIEPNNSLNNARSIHLPFSSGPITREYTNRAGGR